MDVSQMLNQQFAKDIETARRAVYDALTLAMQNAASAGEAYRNTPLGDQMDDLARAIGAFRQDRVGTLEFLDRLARRAR